MPLGTTKTGKRFLHFCSSLWLFYYPSLIQFNTRQNHSVLLHVRHPGLQTTMHRIILHLPQIESVMKVGIGMRRHTARQSVVVIACISRELKQFLANNPISVNMRVTTNIIPVRITGKHLAARFLSVSIRFTRCPVLIDQRRVVGPVEIVGG